MKTGQESGSEMKTVVLDAQHSSQFFNRQAKTIAGRRADQKDLGGRRCQGGVQDSPEIVDDNLFPAFFEASDDRVNRILVGNEQIR